MHIFYGLNDTYVDVTDLAFRFCYDDGRIQLPADDVMRAIVFGDPLPGVVKNVVVFRTEGAGQTCTVYPNGTPAALMLSSFEQMRWLPPTPIRVPAGLPVEAALARVHEQLKFVGGSLDDEGPEQAMVLRYLDPGATVLEIGSNIGRNTMMISAVLADSANLLTLECNPAAVEVLRFNRNANGFRFAIEASALSSRPLMRRGWNTIPGDDLLEGHTWVSTITYEELRAKYGMAFDTLVADCEGALYYILSDNPAVLDGIGTVILEADYTSLEHKRAVEAVFAGRGLTRIHSEPLVTDWAHQFPDEVAASFFEVWTR